MTARQWQLDNSKFLAAAVKWLRLCLSQLARSPSHSSAENSESQVASLQKDIEVAAKAMAVAALGDPPPALILLCQQLGLSEFERSLLLLCAAMELDTGMGQLCAEAQGNMQCPYPTFALAFSCFENPEWDSLSPERPLRYWRLLEIHQSGAQPLTASPLQADERIVNYLKGLNYLDDRLASLMLPLNPWEGIKLDKAPPLPPSHQQAVAEILQQIEQAEENQRFPIVQLTGIDVSSKQLIAWLVCQELEVRLYRLHLESLPTQSSELETIARLWERESLLLPIALYVDVQGWEDSTNSADTMATLRRFLNLSDGIFFLGVREAGLMLDRPAVTFDIAKPTKDEERSLWEMVLGSQAGNYPIELVNQFHLNLIDICKIGQTALAGIQSQDDSLGNHLWASCLSSTRPRLDTLAQRLEPKATWEHLVLPAAEKELLYQIADQVQMRHVVYDEGGFRQRMNRGLGISVLFAGESGTGKTMAAEVLANELRLNLYRIDLSAVVSKYIGETEKNLRRLFDAAEDGGAILFFDEADALFGKRSEVKDSHDRYANIEINYLLQRLEAYQGLAILATNLKSALDRAFLRRLRFIVDFPFPSLVERQSMWEKAFPPQTQTEGLDFPHLAKFNLTGGNIHNIALHAAFLAAKAGTPVRMESVLAAARAEFRKLDRPINEADFRVSASTEVRV